MGNNPSDFTKCDSCPVEKVSWEDVQEYLSKLNSLSNKRYRLPTEAEWEYAARGGSSNSGYKYSGSNNIGEVGWYNHNSNSKTHPVGGKSKNKLDIYDMSGNVCEWCSDGYGSYSASDQTNPTGALRSDLRVFRGGSWHRADERSRVSYRNSSSPTIRYSSLGFRVVLLPFQ